MLLAGRGARRPCARSCRFSFLRRALRLGVRLASAGVATGAGPTPKRFRFFKVGAGSVSAGAAPAVAALCIMSTDVMRRFARRPILTP